MIYVIRLWPGKKGSKLGSEIIFSLLENDTKIINNVLWLWFYEMVNWKLIFYEKTTLRRPGIEPESREWESRMITITPTVLVWEGSNFVFINSTIETNV